jgi:hypothetical protein
MTALEHFSMIAAPLPIVLRSLLNSTDIWKFAERSGIGCVDLPKVGAKPQIGVRMQPRPFNKHARLQARSGATGVREPIEFQRCPIGSARASKDDRKA